jgi:hypothetical protein
MVASLAWCVRIPKREAETMARGAGARARRDLLRETTCHFCSSTILHVAVARRSTPGGDWVSMPPGTFARLNPQPDEDGWYVFGDDWFAFDPEHELDGARFTTHTCGNRAR